MLATIHIRTGNTIMPKIRKNETKSEYIPRAIRYLMKKEGLSQKYAVGKAHGIWRQHLKERRKK